MHMIALYTVWYNFVKMHKTLRMSPALAAGMSTTQWGMGDLVALIGDCPAMDTDRAGMGEPTVGLPLLALGGT